MEIFKPPIALVRTFSLAPGRSWCVGESLDTKHDIANNSDRYSKRARLHYRDVSSGVAFPTRHICTPATLSSKDKDDACPAYEYFNLETN